MSKSNSNKLFIVALLASSAFLPQTSVAQIAPQNIAVDEYGIDLLHWGPFDPGTNDVSIGQGANGLTYSRSGLFSGQDLGSYFVINDHPNSGDEIVNLGSTSVRFTWAMVNGIPTYTDQSGRGYVFGYVDGGYLITAPDGTKYEFSHWSGIHEQNDQVAYLTKIIKPDGGITKVTWSQFHYNWWNGETTNYEFYDRIQAVENNFGYMLKLDYQSDVEPLFDSNWLNLSSVTAINKTIEYCDPMADDCAVNPATSPKATYVRPNAETLIVTSPGGRTRTYASTYDGQNYGSSITGDAAENRQITGSGYAFTVTRNGSSATYTTSGNVTTRTESNGRSTVYTVGPANGVFSRIESVKDPLNRTTTYEYDSNNRRKKVIKPEGNYTEYTYDLRGNITEERHVSKTPGTPADIVLTSGFDTACTNAVKCNKPNWTKDAELNQTDYIYDTAHGGLLTVTGPAAASNQPRPAVRNTYNQMQAQFKNATGQIVASGESVYLLTGTSTCTSSSTCTGLAEELKTTVNYGSQAAGIANHLNPVSGTVSSGDNAIVQTTGLTYDHVGNVVAIDGPLAGTVDTTAVRYDAARRVVGQIEPDPDGAGIRINSATRTTYDNLGRTTQLEQGTTNGQSDTAWAGFAPAAREEISFDSSDRMTARATKSGATTYSVSQTSYDHGGRVDCTALRLNPATFGSLPASACDLATTGSFGADRITKYSYSSANEVTQAINGYGTAEQANEVSADYTPNGQLSFVVDAENNRTSYIYDGHDRVRQTRFPMPTKGNNVANSGDYEQLSYDSRGNVTERRLRDATLINYGYDNLNRITSKDLPGTNADTTFTYDLLGRQLSAFTSTLANSFVYDALSRKTRETSAQGQVNYQYDAAGRRSRITYPGATSLYVDYVYDNAGNILELRENDSTAPAGKLATYAYDNLGRRQSVTYGNGTSRSFGYDPVSRLDLLTNNPAGTINDQSISFGYNPASQIETLTKSGDNYAWNGHYNIDRIYTSNGLNQLTSAGSMAFSHDARGNLTVSGLNSYTYSSENRLLTGPGSAALGYDAVGRLQKISNGGQATRFQYDGVDLIAEYSSGSMLRRYVHGPGDDEPILWYEGSSLTNKRYLMSDERGSVVNVTDSVGATLSINKYDEFGIPASTNLGRFGYTGQTWLPEIGMNYYKARIYSPTLGRFMQTDPIGYGDGMNMYNYVGSDPVNSSDPSGQKGTNCVDTGPDSFGNYSSSCHRHRRGNVASSNWPSGGYIFADAQDRDQAQQRNLNRENPNAHKVKSANLSAWCGSGKRNTGSITFGGTAFLLTRGVNVSIEVGAISPVADSPRGNLGLGNQMFIKFNATGMMGAGVFGGAGPGLAGGYTRSSASSGHSSTRGLYGGAAWGWGAEGSYSDNGDVSISGGGPRGGAGAYIASGETHSWTAASKPIGCKVR